MGYCYEKFNDSFSNLIQFSPMKGCLADRTGKEMRHSGQFIFWGSESERSGKPDFRTATHSERMREAL